MDTFSMIALGSGAVAGGIALTSLFNKNTSVLTKAVSGLTTGVAGLNIATVPAIENSGPEGIVFLLITPLLTGASALGASWSLAALHQARSTRRQMEAVQKPETTTQPPQGNDL